MGNQQANQESNPNPVKHDFKTPFDTFLSKIKLPVKPPPLPPPLPQQKFQNMNLILGVIDKKQKMLHFDYSTESLIEIEPPNFPFHNYASFVMVDPDHAYMTGGITSYLQEIVKSCYEMNTSSPIKFSKLPNLTMGRYTHMSVVHKEILYVLGGRTYGDDQVGILSHCETLDLRNLNNNPKWNPIAKMRRSRCTGLVIIYQDQIYAFGGYTAPKKRSKKVERYNEAKDEWELLQFKLKEGVEAGSIYPIDLDEFVLVGGNSTDGLSKVSYLYNVHEESVKEYPHLNNARVLQKTFIDLQGGNIYVLGGDPNNTSEKLAYLTKENWEMLPMDLDKYASSKDFKSFCQLTPIIIVHSVENKKPMSRKEKELKNNQEEEKKLEYMPLGNPFSASKNLEPLSKEKPPHLFKAKVNELDPLEKAKLNLEIKKEQVNPELFPEEEQEVLPEETDQRIYLFGTDSESIIIEYNLNKNKSRAIAVQPPLQLQCYQSGVKTSDSCYFIAGGINSSLTKIFEDTFLYMSFDNMAFKLEPMQTPRYTFNLVLQHPWVYALGGRTYGTDEVGVLNACERYHLEKQYWEPIASLNFKRCTAMAFSWSNGIYVAGGYMGSLKRETRFECYIETNNKWELMGIELEEALEASSFLLSENKLLFIGGRIQAGDTDKIWSYDVGNGFDAFHGGKVGNLKMARCLHKTCQVDKNNFLVLGGNNFDNLFETFNYDKEKNMIVNNGEKSYDFIHKEFRRNVRKYFKESNLHKNMLL